MCSKLMAHVSRRVHLAATSSKMFHMFHISRPVQRGYLVLKCLEQTWKTVPHVSRKKQTANFASKHIGILAKGEGSFLEMAYCILYVFLGLLVWCVFYPSKNRQKCPGMSIPEHPGYPGTTTAKRNIHKACARPANPDQSTCTWKRLQKDPVSPSLHSNWVKSAVYPPTKAPRLQENENSDRDSSQCSVAKSSAGDWFCKFCDTYFWNLGPSKNCQEHKPRILGLKSVAMQCIDKD